MKVLVIASDFPNNIQFAKGIFIKQQILALSRRCQLKVVAPVPFSLPLKAIKHWFEFSQVKQYENINGLEVFHPRRLITPKIGRSFYGLYYFLGIYPTMKRIKASFNFDTILAYFAYPDGFAAAIAAKLLKKPLIIKVLGSDINIFMKSKIRRQLTKYAFDRAQRIIAVSNELKNKIIALGIPPEKVVVISNGVDPEMFFPMDKSKCRERLLLPADRKIILFIGNLIKSKGIHVLLEAFRQLLTVLKEKPVLAFVGDGPERKALERNVKENNIDKYVMFKGTRLHEDIPIWINSCDVFCLPSFNEGCPNVVLEALACSKPVVATRVGAIPEMINKEDGILCEPDDPDSLRSALEKMLEKSQTQTHISMELKKITWDSVGEEIFNVLKSQL